MSQAQSLPRHFLQVCGAAVLATGVYAAWLGWQIGGETSVLYFSDAGTVLASLLASVACLRAGVRHEGRLRVFWWLMTAACTAWMLGEMIWTGYDLTGTGPPTPSFADGGYLTFTLLAVAALLYHPALHGSGVGKVRTLIDGLSIAVALLFLSWTSVLGPLWRGSDLTTLGGLVTMAYPAGDVVIAFLVILALRRMGTGERLGFYCLLAGLIALALADTAYAYVAQVKGYASGNLLDTGWFAGFLGIALGAFASNRRDSSSPADSALLDLPSLIAPLVPMLIALSVAGITLNPDEPPDWVALIMVGVLIVLAIGRQGLLVLDVVTAGRGEQQGSMFDRIAHVVLSRARPEKGRDKPSVPRPERT